MSKELVKIETLYDDLELASKNNELNRLLAQPPKKEWIKQNKFADNTEYLPIDKVEFLLVAVYGKFSVEIKSVSVIANSVVVVVRLHVRNPVSGEHEFQDGVGAAPIQTDKGAAATDFSKVKTSAVQMCSPAAESYAIKDAAEKFGRLFGKDLNRKDVASMSAFIENKSVLFDEILKERGMDNG